MVKNAWEYTLEIISIAGDIDNLNDSLSKIDDVSERMILSSKVDALESKLFEIRDKLKSIKINY